MNLVWGVCGIGRGHLARQSPLIESFLQQGANIDILAYGEALAVLERRYHDHPAARVLPTAVPFWSGSPTGLDFQAAAARAGNFTGTLELNTRTLSRVQERMPAPDLVLTDYEPTAAQYAYATNTPLVTIDQQSKYLLAPSMAAADELARLRMLFPAATARIAASFFRLTPETNTPEVHLVPPPLRSEVRAARTAKEGSILVYLTSSEAGDRQDAQELVDTLSLVHSVTGRDFALYLPVQELVSSTNGVVIHAHGTASFLSDLLEAPAIISTAGHGLLSEAMALNTPVLALPTSVWEQQVNAKTIHNSGFGLAVENLTKGDIIDFLADGPSMSTRIRLDDRVLLRGDGTRDITNRIQKLLL